MNKIIIYADGGCRNNQCKENIGGWGAYLTKGEYIKELYGSAKNTTNNKMELTSAIEGLKVLKKYTTPVEVHMDSAYVVNGINSWVTDWIKKNWRKSDGKPVENKELWQELWALKSKFNDIKFIKVKGHSGNDGNEKADELANKAMDECV